MSSFGASLSAACLLYIAILLSTGDVAGKLLSDAHFHHHMAALVTSLELKDLRRPLQASQWSHVCRMHQLTRLEINSCQEDTEPTVSCVGQLTPEIGS